MSRHREQRGACRHYNGEEVNGLMLCTVSVQESGVCFDPATAEVQNGGGGDRIDGRRLADLMIRVRLAVAPKSTPTASRRSTATILEEA